MFMFACSLAFMLPWTFALAGVEVAAAAGLGDAATFAFMFMLFALSAVAQATPKIAIASTYRLSFA